MRNKEAILNKVTLRKMFRFALLLAIFVLVASVIYAQDPGEPGIPGQNNDVPLDGGVSVLVAMAVGYRARKEIQKRKAAKEQDSTEGKD